jgi:hypothetical protein
MLYMCPHTTTYMCRPAAKGAGPGGKGKQADEDGSVPFFVFLFSSFFSFLFPFFSVHVPPPSLFCKTFTFVWRILLFMCRILLCMSVILLYVSCCYICVLMLCSVCVLMLCSVCVLMPCGVCVLILLCTCPHTAVYVQRTTI